MPRILPRIPSHTPSRFPRRREPDPALERTPLAAVPPGRHRGGEAETAASFGLDNAEHRISLPRALALRLPDRLIAARLVGPRRAVLGLIVVTVLVCCALGLRFAMASAAAGPVSVDPPRGGPWRGAAFGRNRRGDIDRCIEWCIDRCFDGPPDGFGAADPGAGAVAAANATSAVLVVDVAGRVHHPGVLRLPAGSRVQDALVAAGGALPGSDLVSLNLAQPLGDGEQVVVGPAARGGPSRTSEGSAAGSQSSGVSGGSGVGGPSGAGSAGGSVDLNSADVAALDSLPGVGPVLAQRILDWRSAHGRFTSIDELDEVSGIGEKLLAQIRPHVQL